MTLPGRLEADWPAPPGVRAFVTTREGGAGGGAFQSFNLSHKVGDETAAVDANRRRLRTWLPADPRWLRQVHGSRVVDADTVADTVDADAAVTRVPGVVCTISIADCLPVLFCDRAGSVVAAAHAGWRGLASGVLENTIAAMQCPPAALLAWLGPGIGPTAFEVGADVHAAFVQQDAAAARAFQPHTPGKWLCDLFALARQRLARAGVTAVHGGGRCTYREASHFFSYRRDGMTGRMAACIWLQGV